MYLCTYSQPVCVTVCNYRHVMSILPPIMLVKGWYRLFGTLREPETARDETEECQIKNDPRSCERNFCNCVISLKKKIQDFNGRYGNEPKTSVLLKGFGRSIARIVPDCIRGVPLLVSIARGHSGDKLTTIRLFVIQPNVSKYMRSDTNGLSLVNLELP